MLALALNTSDLLAQTSSFAQPANLFVILFVVLVVLYGMSVGKTRAVLSLLSMYGAYTLVIAFPFTSTITVAEPYIVRIGLFVLAYIGTFFALSKSALKSRFSMSELSFSRVFIISIFQVGILASMLMSLAPDVAFRSDTQTLSMIVNHQYALFIWSAVSFLILPFLRKSSS